MREDTFSGRAITIFTVIADVAILQAMTHGRNNDTPALNASQHWAAGREPCRGEIPVERSQRRLNLLRILGIYAMR